MDKESSFINNTNNQTSASSDWLAYNDQGLAANAWIDMGINSSTYNQTGYGLTGPNDGYVYVTGNTSTGGGALVLSTYTPKDIIFSQNGGDTPNETARFQYGVGFVMKNLPIKFADDTTQNTAAAPLAFSQANYNLANTNQEIGRAHV